MPHSERLRRGLFVVLDVLEIVPGLSLDVLVHRHALDHAPGESPVGDHLLACLDLLDRPHLTVRNMMERVNDVRHTGLAYVVQGDRVVGAVPSPTLPHQK